VSRAAFIERLGNVGITGGVTMVRPPRRRVALLVLAGLAALGAGARVVSASEKATPIGRGVVVIDTNLAYQGASAAGTGIVLSSSGTVLTNNHVIDGATTIKAVLPGTGRSYTARVVGYDRTADVAVLQLQNASNLKTLRWGDSSSLTVGTLVTALGNAGGTGSFTSATGSVTGLDKTITASDDQGGSEQLTGLIETNAGVVPGDSGGPLLDSAGRVVGMDTAASSGAGYEAIAATDAYAIPIARAVKIAQEIEAGDASATVHIGGTAFLGVEVEPLGSDGSGYGGYRSTPASGALVAGVVSGGPAASAGLTAGDVITAIDGRGVTSPTTISSLIVTMKPGAKITVTYTDQAGGTGTVRVTLGSGPPR
jgi:S1-C subfamily serine protease